MTFSKLYKLFHKSSLPTDLYIYREFDGRPGVFKMDDGSKVTDTIVLYRIYLYIRHKWNFFCQAANLFSGELLILLFRIVLFHYNHYFHSFGETIINNETINVKKDRTTDFDQNSSSKL